MSLITLDELARGAALLTFGSLAGLTASVWAPASAWWLLPAGCAALGGALTVPEVRQELQRALPAARPLLDAPGALGQWVRTGELPPALWQLPGVKAPAEALAERPARKRATPEPAPWLRTLNDEPDRAPHAIVFGPSGAGKTTLARAFLGAREGAAVVLSPKIAADNWHGAEVVTLDDEGAYTPIVATLAELEAEKRRRIGVLRREGAHALAPLSIVLDEVPELTANVKEAGPFIVSMAGIGRELKMRLVCLSTSERVGALGIKGRGDTLANFVRVDLDRERRGTLNDGVSTTPIGAPASWGRLAERSTLRPWHEPEPAAGTTQIGLRPGAVGTSARVAVAAEGARAVVVSERVRPQAAPDDLLATLLASPVSNASQSVRHGAGVSVSVTGAVDTDTDTGGVSRADTVLDTAHAGGPTLRIDVHARAEAEGGARRSDPAGRRRGGLDARRRRLLAEQRRLDARKAELRAAYVQRKAAGLSYRAAYAELGGASDDTRAWWRAAPGPAMKGVTPDA